ncbi:hypothetical protein ACFSQ7_23645 [Paenibacillus rhizoplanae]
MSAKASDSKVLRVVLMLLMTLLVLSACSSAPSPEPTRPPQPTEAPEEGQMITVITPDNKNIDADSAPKYQIQTRLTDFRLLNASAGLAWGVTRNELRMYMTLNNGKTWANISPATNVQFLNNPVYGKEIFLHRPRARLDYPQLVRLHRDCGAAYH